jgi:hypothetical protein
VIETGDLDRFDPIWSPLNFGNSFFLPSVTNFDTGRAMLKPTVSTGF